MRKVLVVVAIFVLVYFFFHYRRGEMVKQIYDTAIAQLDQGKLSEAISTLDKHKSYSGHAYLRPKLAEYKDKFYLRVRDDMLAMAEEDKYIEPGDYNVTVALNAILAYEPQPDWAPQAYSDLADIAFAHDLFFLTDPSERTLQAGKALFDLLSKNPNLSSAQTAQAIALRNQLGLRWQFEYNNWQDQYKKEMRNGKPYFFDSWLK